MVFDLQPNELVSRTDSRLQNFCLVSARLLTHDLSEWAHDFGSIATYSFEERERMLNTIGPQNQFYLDILEFVFGFDNSIPVSEFKLRIALSGIFETTQFREKVLRDLL